MEINTIFVYGTLRKNASSMHHDLIEKNCKYASKGYVQAKLFLIDDYPGIVLSEVLTDRVRGELYIINSKCNLLEQLDLYEECNNDFPTPHEYTRTLISSTLDSGTKIMSWVYLYNFNTENLEQIHSGDYIEYLNI